MKSKKKIFAGCIMEQDIDYYGNDIVDQVVESMQACADFCASTGGGQFWTWNRGTNRCHVKRSKSGERSEVVAVSGNRYCGSAGIETHLLLLTLGSMFPPQV